MKLFHRYVVLVLTAFTASCVTVNEDTVQTMSDGYICELLGPAWLRTASEDFTLRLEASRRDLLCQNGYLVGYTSEGKLHEGRGPTPSSGNKDNVESGSGTGFFINAEGHVLTNAHVVSECAILEVEPIGKASLPAQIVAIDNQNDLAVIRSDSNASQYAKFRSGAVRQGEDIVVYGFPLLGALSSTGNATTGNVTALAGLGDDTRMLQISAPVQPGNSGGPLLDSSGAVVGIVVAKLNAAKVYEAIGDIPQNINFAVKANVAKGFLESYGIEYQSVGESKELSVPDVADLARGFSVRVLCYQ